MSAAVSDVAAWSTDVGAFGKMAIPRYGARWKAAAGRMKLANKTKHLFMLSDAQGRGSFM